MSLERNFLRRLYTDTLRVIDGATSRSTTGEAVATATGRDPDGPDLHYAYKELGRKGWLKVENGAGMGLPSYLARPGG